jgi:AcrR family transcriptional regulator
MPTRSPQQSTLGRPANPEARAQRREQILAGARACFLRKGFHAASTAEISAEAGVSVANLYQYFPTKEELVQALVEEDLHSDLALLHMIDEAATLAEGLERTTDLAISDPDMQDYGRLRLEILAEAARNPAIAEIVRRADDRMVGALAQLIERRQASGEVDRAIAPTTTARLLLSFFDGLAGRLAFGLSDPEELARTADRIILAAFRAPLDTKA